MPTDPDITSRLAESYTRTSQRMQHVLDDLTILPKYTNSLHLEGNRSTCPYEKGASIPLRISATNDELQVRILEFMPPTLSCAMKVQITHPPDTAKRHPNPVFLKIFDPRWLPNLRDD